MWGSMKNLPEYLRFHQMALTTQPGEHPWVTDSTERGHNVDHNALNFWFKISNTSGAVPVRASSLRSFLFFPPFLVPSVSAYPSPMHPLPPPSLTHPSVTCPIRSLLAFSAPCSLGYCSTVSIVWWRLQAYLSQLYTDRFWFRRIPLAFLHIGNMSLKKESYNHTSYWEYFCDVLSMCIYSIYYPSISILYKIQGKTTNHVAFFAS